MQLYANLPRLICIIYMTPTASKTRAIKWFFWRGLITAFRTHRPTLPRAVYQTQLH